MSSWKQAAVVAWVDYIDIKWFNFKSKTFLVCINGKERSCGAGELIEHHVDDALHFLYDKHFWDGHVQQWVNRSRIVQGAVDGWVCLEQYAQKMRWPDSHLKKVSSPSSVLDGEVSHLLGCSLPCCPPVTSTHQHDALAILRHHRISPCH